MPLTTIGHGTASRESLGELLLAAEVDLVVDVRRFPGSRRHPHVARSELKRWLPELGIDYRWDPRLGGRRRPDPASPHRGLRNTSFRAYADHMHTEEFQEALAELLDEARDRSVCIMCSESLWWRCHRRLIADYVTGVHGWDVRHRMHDGRDSAHIPTDVAQVVDGRLRYEEPA